MVENNVKPCILNVYGNGYPDMLVDELGFSWQVNGVTGAQKAYCLSLSGPNGEAVWDTGWVESNRSAGIAYDGPELQSNAAYAAQVCVRAEDGAEYRSDPAAFTTGFLKADDWKSQWLVSPYALETAGSPVYRRQLSIAKPIRRARLFISGLGYYELHVNGRVIGDRYMDPAWTDYSKRVNYVAYDVTDALRVGENVLGVCLAAGWYTNDAAMPRPTFIAQLMIDYADGTSDCIPTRANGAWRVLKASWMLSCSIYIGEVVDARRYPAGWDTVDYVAEPGTWQPALEGEAPLGRLTPMRVEPIRCVRRMPAATVSEPRPGVYVVDFAQNMAGIVELYLHGTVPGERVQIRYAEILDAEGMLSTENLREAQARDVYIARGGEEVYRSRFTYHGFRYAEVTGLNAPLAAEDITALVMRNDVAVRSKFESSCALVNDIQRICVWTENNNLHGVPTDCPQRNERLGWLNDLTVRLEESIYNFEMATFYRKFLEDIMDTQGAHSGAIADTAPYVRYGGRPADAVCSSYLLLPWMIHQHYDDPALLKKAWPGIRAWTDYLARQRADGIVTYSYYGDWAAPIGGNVRFSVGAGAVSAITPGPLMSTGFLYMNCRLLTEIANILDLPEEVKHYTALAEETRDALNRVFLNREEGFYATNSQAANTFMLYLGIVPEECRQRVLEHLVADILAHDTHTTTGNLCSRYILDVLAENGRIDLAWAIVNQTTYPSWGYMLSRGATTTWERWEYVDSGELIGMASHDHPMYSTVSGWFYKYLAGFRTLEPGFAAFELKPFFPGELDSVRACVNTCKGEASIAWEKQGNRVNANVAVPFNSCCVFSLSVEGVRDITVDGEIHTAVRAVELKPGVHCVSFDI